MRGKQSKSTMYAKMFLVTPMVYEKLKRCLDKTDVSNLNRINKPFVTTQQNQVFNQHLPSLPQNFQDSSFRRPTTPAVFTPSQAPLTSERKIEQIVQREMGTQPSPIRMPESNVPEFEEVSNPYIDESFGMDYQPIDWDRPIPTQAQETQTEITPQFEQATQTYYPFSVEQETQTLNPIHVEQETQTYAPFLHVDQETQTMPSSPVLPDLPEIQPDLPAIQQQQPEQFQTESETALVPVTSVVPYSDDFPDFTPEQYSQMAQVRFRPPPLQPSINYERRKRIKQEKRPRPNLRTRMVSDVLVTNPRSLEINPNDPHSRHFGQQLRQYARSHSTNQRPALSEVVFSGQELPEPEQFEALQGPPVLPALTHQSTQQQNVPRQLELTFQPDIPLHPRDIDFSRIQVPRITTPSSGSLIYREPPRAIEYQPPRLALTHQKKRPLPESGYIPPEKIKRSFTGPIPKIIVTPPEEEKRTTRGIKRTGNFREPPAQVPKQKKNFQCDVCGLMLSTNYSLNRHKKREQQRLQKTNDPTDFTTWLQTRQKQSKIEEPEKHGLKRTATDAKLPTSRKIKRVATSANEFPNWYLRPPEKF